MLAFECRTSGFGLMIGLSALGLISACGPDPPPSAPVPAPPAPPSGASLPLEPDIVPLVPEDWPDANSGEETQSTCSSPRGPSLVQLRFSENSVVAMVGDEESQEQHTWTASDLGLSDYRISVAESPSSQSPYFYVVANKGPVSVLRIYCKDGGSAVAQRWIHEPEKPRDGALVFDVAATQELALRALAFRFGARRIEIWSMADHDWKTLPAVDSSVGLALGLGAGGLRYSYLTHGGQLVTRTSGQSTPDFESPLLGRRVDRDGLTAIMDRSTAIYVLTPGWGAAYELATEQTTSLYEFDDATRFLWWDRFFGPEGGNKIGFFLLSRSGEGPLAQYQGQVFVHDYEGFWEVPETIDLNDHLELLGSGEARIYLRPQDGEFKRLRACLIANVGKLEDRRGVVRELDIRQHFQTHRWRADEIRSEELDSVGMEHVKIIGDPASKTGVFYDLLSGDTEDSFRCSLLAQG